MSKTRLFAGGAALLVLVSAAGAFAVPSLFHARRASSAELTAASAGAGSLGSAISAVERLTGGRVLEIHFESNNGAGYYDATVTRGGSVDHAVVNLKTKQVAVVDQARNPVRTFDFREKAGVELIVRSSRVDLGSAVAGAEQVSRGVAVAARTASSRDGNMVAHDIETVKGEMVHPVLIDAKTSLVIRDPQAFEALP